MSFPFSRQHDTMLCGVACLSMICRYYGKEESSKYLLNCCRPTSEGVSMLTLNDAAIALGFRAVCARISPSKLVQNSFPCILHWNQNHFVVLYKIKKGRTFYIADPGKGLVKYNLEEFKSHWISTRSNGEEKGIAMFLEPTPSFYSHKEDGEGEKNKNPRSFRFLFGYVKKYRRYFGQIVLGLIVGSLPSAIPSRLRRRAR